jgi:hypothetical protein
MIEQQERSLKQKNQTIYFFQMQNIQKDNKLINSIITGNPDNAMTYQ